MPKDNLIERLRAKQRRRDLETGGGMVSTDGKVAIWTYGEVWELRNPDGHAAASEIERLEAALSRNQALIEEMVEGLKRIAYRRPAGDCKNQIIIDIETIALQLIAKATDPDHAL